jgi:phage-related minor tail protein
MTTSSTSKQAAQIKSEINNMLTVVQQQIVAMTNQIELLQRQYDHLLKMRNSEDDVTDGSI